MEKSASTTDAPKVQEPKESWLNRTLKVAAYPIAALSGLWAAGRELHYAAYKTIQSGENNPLFKEIKNTYEPSFAKNAHDLASKTITEEKFLSEFIRIKGEHSHAVGAKMQSLGLGNELFGLKDMPKKWSTVNRDARNRALITGATVTGIAIGAMLTIANSKTLEQFFGKENER